MNPLTNVKNINKLNEIELSRGTVDKKSWHDMYKESAWIFIGGLAYGLTEGDILSVFSQYGEIVNINLIRDSKTGKIKGFCFLCYANQKSTILAVDNLNGIKLCGRTIRVDHVANYKPPKEHENDDDLTKMLKNEGCAPKPIKVESAHGNATQVKVEKKKSKKVKKEKKKHKKKNKRESQEETPSSKQIKVKEEKVDPGYSKYEFPVEDKSSKRKNKQRDSTDSEDSEESSSESESSDSETHSRLPRKELARPKQNEKQSERNLKEKHNSYNKIRYEASTSSKKATKRAESSSDSYDESDNRKKVKYDDSVSSKRKSNYNEKRDRSLEDKDHYSSNKHHKNKYSFENERSSKHDRNHRGSSSESDVIDKSKSRVSDSGRDRSKYRDKREESEDRYERKHRRHESHRRKDEDYSKSSQHSKH